MNIKENLLAFGLNPIEISIYLYLIKEEPQTVLEISREINIPRTSVYDNVHKLIDKGLVEYVLAYKTKKYKAFPPDILESIIEEKKAQTRLMEESLSKLKLQLPLIHHQSTGTQVRYYFGVDGFQQMLYNNLRAKSQLFGYSEFGRQNLVGVNFMKNWHQRIIEKGLNDRVITNPSEETLKYLSIKDDPSAINKYRQSYEKVRFLSDEIFYISGDTTMYNNVCAIQHWKNNELIGIEIENDEFMKTQKSIFEILWKLAKTDVDLEKL